VAIHDFFEKFQDRETDQLIAQLKAKAIRDGAVEKYPPLPLETVRACERLFGFRLPRLLTRVYTEVANGGVGPDGELVGLNGGKGSSFNETFILDVVGVYNAFSDLGFGWDELDPDNWGDYLWHWPKGVLPICDWGNFDITVVDCRAYKQPVFSLNYEAAINYKKAYRKRKTSNVFQQPTTLVEWFTASLDGKDSAHRPVRMDARTQREKLGLPPRPRVSEPLAPRPVRDGKVDIRYGSW
jgi:hypothetical protein